MSPLVVVRVMPGFKNGSILRLLKYYECENTFKKQLVQHIRHSHVAIKTTGHHSKGTKISKSFLCSKYNERSILGPFVPRLLSTNAVEEQTTDVAAALKEGIISQPVQEPTVASTNAIINQIPEPTPITIDQIPEPPSIPIEVLDTVQLVGEPSFASLGLGGSTPVGIVENCMEFLHVDCSIPWWMAIAMGTVVVRILIFPLVILAQRNAAKMNNNLPQLQTIQLKMTEARQSGNQLEAARYAQELMIFMKEKELNPLKNMVVPIAQAPLFISFFMALRSMANVPVESMTTGGMLWFTDLTMPDEYFLLPIITSATLYLTIEIGTDSARLSAANMHMMKYVLRALPVFILPFTVNFPGAVLCYWLSSNFISLLQVGFLKIPSVRDYFKIEPLVTHVADSLPVKPKGFVKGFQDSWTNMKITKEMEERQRFDEMRFQRAGAGPIQKTYKYDPTRPKQSISAKKLD